MSKLTIELTPDEIKAILAAHVGSLDYVRQHVAAKDVSLEVEVRNEDRSTFSYPIFTGAKVTVTQ